MRRSRIIAAGEGGEPRRPSALRARGALEEELERDGANSSNSTHARPTVGHARASSAVSMRERGRARGRHPRGYRGSPRRRSLGRDRGERRERRAARTPSPRASNAPGQRQRHRSAPLRPGPTPGTAGRAVAIEATRSECTSAPRATPTRRATSREARVARCRPRTSRNRRCTTRHPRKPSTSSDVAPRRACGRAGFQVFGSAASWHTPSRAMASTACFASARVASASAASTSSSSDCPPRRDYAALFARGRAPGGCPPLFLAPMEGLGDHRLRRALALSTGGFDEACREFTRVPGVLSQGAKPERLLRGIALKGYDARELVHPDSRAPHLLGAQLMGSNTELLERCAQNPRRGRRRPSRRPQLRLPRQRRHRKRRRFLTPPRPARRRGVRRRGAPRRRRHGRRRHPQTPKRVRRQKAYSAKTSSRRRRAAPSSSRSIRARARRDIPGEPSGRMSRSPSTSSTSPSSTTATSRARSEPRVSSPKPDAPG